MRGISQLVLRGNRRLHSSAAIIRSRFFHAPLYSMDKTYSPREIETRLYQRWEGAGWFAPRAVDANAAAFCIMIPPPNVTGTLHMGHAFQHTLMDALTRFHRMESDTTLWQP